MGVGDGKYLSEGDGGGGVNSRGKGGYVCVVFNYTVHTAEQEGEKGRARR